MARGFESLHPPLPLAGRPMRVLAPVIEVAALTVFHSWQDLTFGRAIAFELIRDDDPRDILQPFQEFTEKLLRRLLVTPMLHQDVEDVVILIDSAPQAMPFPIDGQKHLIKVPRVTRLGASVLQLIRVRLPKLQTPLADGFMGDVDAALAQELLHVSVA
jgi:hypothetical protein